MLETGVQKSVLFGRCRRKCRCVSVIRTCLICDQVLVQGKDAPSELLERYGELNSSSEAEMINQSLTRVPTVESFRRSMQRGGMSVLRAALRIAGEHYPELPPFSTAPDLLICVFARCGFAVEWQSWSCLRLSRVVFLRSDWLFSLAFKVFRLWAHKKTRDA